MDIGSSPVGVLAVLAAEAGSGESSPLSLVVILGAAVAAPILAELLRRWRVPSVLFELLLGILIGPQVLGWAELTPFVTDLADVGLAFLFFFAGYEIDFARVRGTPLNRGVIGWLGSLVLGLAVAGVLVIEGFAVSDLLIGLALTTTAIGTLLPMMRDRGLLETPIGGLLVAAGAVGEFGPILVITLLLTGDNPATEALLLVVFVSLAVLVAVVATRPKPPAVLDVLRRHLHTSTQLPVRIVVLLVVAMVLLAFELGLDTLLGAFSAGLIVRLLLSRDQAEGLEPRLEGLGYGFLIPAFFVVSGMRFDVEALFGSASALARVPVFLALFLVVRGLPALLVYRDVLAPRARWGLGIVQATALPLVVVITEIGVQTERMKPENAVALVGAAMVSVLVFPLVGFNLLTKEPAAAPASEPASPT
ncbi:MAG: cation:proton antiporter [Acidimicrobiales bacterium]|jgi:Kef-type K+ transport system membrane component KefB|nr:cation:proton antiporter [Acidimicrobiales bacterium]